MRLTVLIALLVALTGATSSAQGGRISFEIGSGPSMASPIFRHEVILRDPDVGTELTRLSIRSGNVVSGRIAYRVAGSWMLVAEAGRGSAVYDYHYSMIAPLGYSTEDQWGEARRTTFGLSVVRRSPLAGDRFFVEPELGFTSYQLRVGTPGITCFPPSTPFPPQTCFGSARWEQTYSVPSLSAGLAVGYPIVRHIDAQLRGRYSIGRTSTKEAFYVGLIPQYDYAEAPTSQTIRSSHVSVGLRITP